MHGRFPTAPGEILRHFLPDQNMKSKSGGGTMTPKTGTKKSKEMKDKEMKKEKERKEMHSR